MSFFRSATLSVTYSLGQLCLGLLLHPFQTMQNIVRDRYWLWCSFLPFAILLIGFVLWQSVWLLIFWFFAPTPDFLLPAMGFLLRLIKWWFVYFCVFWQIELGLLLIKFTLFFRKKKHHA